MSEPERRRSHRVSFTSNKYLFNCGFADAYARTSKFTEEKPRTIRKRVVAPSVLELTNPKTLCSICQMDLSKFPRPRVHLLSHNLAEIKTSISVDDGIAFSRQAVRFQVQRALARQMSSQSTVRRVVALIPRRHAVFLLGPAIDATWKLTPTALRGKMIADECHLGADWCNRDGHDGASTYIVFPVSVTICTTKSNDVVTECLKLSFVVRMRNAHIAQDEPNFVEPSLPISDVVENLAAHRSLSLSKLLI